MDEKEATKILAKELGNKVGREAVIEDSYKDDLIRNASAAYQVDSPFLIDFAGGKFQGKKSGKDIVEIMLLQKDSFAEANYYFLKTVPQVGRGQSYSKDSQFAVTPYSIIGKKEKLALRKLFYKNVHPEIAYAMKFFEIKNFIDFYATYADKSHDNSLIKILKEEDSIMEEDLEVAKKFIDTALKLKYDHDVEVGKSEFGKNLEDFRSLNVRFERIGVKTRIESHDATSRGYITRATLLKLVGELSSAIKDIKSKCKDTLWNEFVDFVFFYLPVEEQNVESNKAILESSSNLDFVVAVLSKEYSEGKRFQEYFDVLAKGSQDKVVESLKVFSGRKPVYDSFLWSKGFKNIGMDYLKFYKEDADTFIDYFKNRSQDEKKIIMEDIMGCEHINEKAIEWLNKNEADLIREVGLNG